MKYCLCKSQIFFIMILFIVACIIYPSIIWAEETETTTSLQQISEIIASYPGISSFQASRILKEAEKAIQSGISLEDAQEIIQESLEEKIKVDTIIDMFSSLNELAEDGLPTSFIINKIKEGLAKRVSSDEINLSIKEEAENLQFAKYLVEQSISDGADIENKSEAIEILASSLPYNYQEDMITDILVEGLRNKKGIEEVAGAITALSDLLNLDMSITSSIEKEIADYLRERGIAITVKEDETSSAEVMSEEDVVSPTQTTTAPSEEATTLEETSEEEATTPEGPSSEEEVIIPEETPSEEETTTLEESSEEEVPTSEESSEEETTTLEEIPSEEEATTPTQTGGPDAP